MFQLTSVSGKLVSWAYNLRMRRKSSIDLAKQRERVQRVRQMTPAERLKECVGLTELGIEFRRTQKSLLASVPPKPRQ